MDIKTIDSYWHSALLVAINAILARKDRILSGKLTLGEVLEVKQIVANIGNIFVVNNNIHERLCILSHGVTRLVILDYINLQSSIAAGNLGVALNGLCVINGSASSKELAEFFILCEEVQKALDELPPESDL